MSRRGFTLIEVLVALTISVAALLATVQLGRTWWVTQAEDQFFSAFEHHWRHLMQQARGEHVLVKVTWNSNLRRFSFIHYGAGEAVAIRLVVPPSLVVGAIRPTSDITWQPANAFTAMRTYRFTRANGRVVTFTSQLGWGELIRKG